MLSYIQKKRWNMMLSYIQKGEVKVETAAEEESKVSEVDWEFRYSPLFCKRTYIVGHTIHCSRQHSPQNLLDFSAPENN